ncbi:MAG: hypothetical protein ACK2UW_20145, partial [Anaerolineales bacterium]
MRQSTKLAAIVVSFLLVLLIIPFGPGPQNASAQEKFVLKYSTADIEASGGQKNAVIPALKRIEQRSNGRITFQIGKVQGRPTIFYLDGLEYVFYNGRYI